MPAKRPISIGYVVDHPKRDLPGAIAFAHAANLKGCDATIIPLYEQATDVPLLPLDAIVVNFARPSNLELVRGYHNMGIAVFVMDTEGGNQTEAGSNTPSRLASLLRERGFSELLSGYFFWGPQLRDEFVKQSGMKADSLIASGCPRFDYASSRFRSSLKYPLNNYVLVNANYPLVNPLFVSSATRERAAAVEAGWDNQYMRDLAADMVNVFQSFKDTIMKLARDIPHIQFLVRPHPFENIQPYIEAFTSLPNVIVNGTGNVLNVIANARCLVHLNCATAIEATMLERLPVSMEFLNTERLLNHAPLPSRISAQAQSYEHLVDMVLNSDAHAQTFQFQRNYDEQIYPWFYKNDGHAADRMVETILSKTSLRNMPMSVSRSLASSRRSPRLTQRLQSIAGNITGTLLTSRLRAAFRPIRRDKFFAPTEIAAALQDLSLIDSCMPPAVKRARHPISRLPLASVVCHSNSN